MRALHIPTRFWDAVLLSKSHRLAMNTIHQPPQLFQPPTKGAYDFDPSYKQNPDHCCLRIGVDGRSDCDLWRKGESGRGSEGALTGVSFGFSFSSGGIGTAFSTSVGR